ncbi:hypothetical protein BDV95DRAFT_629145 [Massariosphaeria phaeospora]|uniref:SET domain-containing protein n=1 Tax=Massariosphaeria phaeospora TaxID=100035 RepID=A0A7C8M4V6_9PLEO|nr:hypothetical protein BDV95DRAFT_629145 [Massariosphaeria phaeospora]
MSVRYVFFAVACTAGAPEAYMIGSSPGKGLGVFATQALEPGDIIMRDRPVIRITPPPFHDGIGYSLNEVGVLLRREFELLAEDARADILSLTAHMTAAEKEAIDQLVPIFRSNAYNTDQAISLFPKVARINHSCRPNVGYAWSERLDKQVVTALRPIDQGEEIFVSYIPLLHSREDRQKRLDQYGFKCTCEVCAQDTAGLQASDQRRKDISKAFSDFEPQLTLSVPQSKAAKKKAHNNAKASIQLAELVQEEGLADYYVTAYRVVAILHARIEDWKEATLWGHRSYKLSKMVDPQSDMTKELVAMTNEFISRWNDDVRNRSRKTS